MAVSSSGDTIALGAPGTYGTETGVFVFIRSGADWIQQGPMLRGSTNVVDGLIDQPMTIALASNGNILAMGSSLEGDVSGSAWVFNRR